MEEKAYKHKRQLLTSPDGSGTEVERTAGKRNADKARAIRS
ncbi:hypothetical protein [Flavobacterium sp.]